MKWIISLSALVLLVFLFTYSLNQHADHYPTIKDLLDDPEKYHNKVTEQNGVILLESSTLKKGDEEIRIVSDKPLREPIKGTISILGRFDKEGYIELQDIHYSDYNNFKYITSLIGFVLFLFIFFKEWKITRKGFKNARLD